MRKYFTTLRLSLIDDSLFKLNYYLSFISIPIQLSIIYFFWKVGLGEGSIKGFSLSKMVLYFLFVRLLQIVYQPAMYTTYELWNEINKGTIIVWILRPISYPLYMLSKKFGIFVVRILSSLIVINFLLYFLGWQVVFKDIGLGVLSSMMGYIILYEIQFFIGALTFWLKNIISLRDTVMDMMALLGGMVIPLDFFPDTLKSFSLLSPMASIYYYPAKILAGGIDKGLDFYKIFSIQFIWLVFFALIIGFVWHLGSGKVDQGS